MNHVIEALEHELEATQQRCQQIERALNGLREIYGDTAPANGKRKYTCRTQKPARKKRTNQRKAEPP